MNSGVLIGLNRFQGVWPGQQCRETDSKKGKLLQHYFYVFTEVLP